MAIQELSNIEWFDRFEGPKVINANNAEVCCFVGYNKRTNDETCRIIGKDVSATEPSLDAAIGKVREQYERDVLPLDVLLSIGNEGRIIKRTGRVRCSEELGSSLQNR